MGQQDSKGLLGGVPIREGASWRSLGTLALLGKTQLDNDALPCL